MLDCTKDHSEDSMSSLFEWTPRERPNIDLEGKFCRLERLNVQHANDLFDVSTTGDAEEIENRFRYLFDYPPNDIVSFCQWIENASQLNDPVYYTVIDKIRSKGFYENLLLPPFD